MANKYIDVSATFNGDGTTSAQAASDGAAGAWNNLRNVFLKTPGFGSVADGDVIFVRTADSGGALGEAFGAATAIGGGTETAPIQYVFDNGDVWTEYGKFLISQGTGTVTFGNYLIITCDDRNYDFYNSYGGSSIITGWLVNACILRNPIFTTVKYAGNGLVKFFLNGSSTAQSTAVIDNPLFNVGMLYTNNSGFVVPSNYSDALMINPVFDMDGCGTTDRWLFDSSTYGFRLHVYGGKVLNSTETQNLIRYTAGTGSAPDITFDGFDPGLLKIAPPVYSSGPANCYTVTLSNIGDLYSYVNARLNGYVSWLAGKNYPTLDAILPDASSTPWSYLVFPAAGGPCRPFPLPQLLKLYTGTSAVKTLTVNFLQKDSYVTKDNMMWATFTYTGSDDVTYCESTLGNGADVANSTAGWSAVIYGVNTYEKKKLELTTAHAIKQNTEIKVKVFIGLVAATSEDFFFVDPELGIA